MNATLTPAQATSAPTPLTDLSYATARQAEKSFQRAIRRGDYPTAPPALAAACGVVDRLAALEQAPLAAERTEQVVERVVEDLVADRAVDPGEYHSALITAHALDEMLLSWMRISQTLQEKVSQRWREVATAALPEVLEGLRTQLADIMVEIRAGHATLAGLNINNGTAVASATDEQRTALVALAPLADRYARLRRLQMVALAWLPVPFVAGVGDRHMTWENVFGTGLTELNWQGGRGPLGGTPDDGPARLLQLATRDDVWLPDLEQLAAVCAKAASASPEPPTQLHGGFLTTEARKGFGGQDHAWYGEAS